MTSERKSGRPLSTLELLSLVTKLNEPPALTMICEGSATDTRAASPRLAAEPVVYSTLDVPPLR